MQSLETPYYAVIFTSRKSANLENYAPMAERMLILCELQPGFLNMVHATTEAGCSVTTCYWKDMASIMAWKAQAEHAHAQEQGIAQWYDEYHVEVACIEKAYSWRRDAGK